MKEKIIALGERLGSIMDRPFAGPTIELKDDLFLPPNIREAIKTRPDGCIYKQELRDLIKNPEFLDQAVYLVMKILDSSPNEQQTFLESLISIAEQNPDNILPTQKLLSHTLDTVPDDSKVQAGKLAQISRQGFYNWDELYRTYSHEWDEKYSDDHPSPVLVAYATLGGLRRFIEAFRDDERKLYILIPNWVNDEQHQDCGYMIDFSTPDGQHVSRLSKSFERPDSAIILDETTATGIGLQQMSSFWKQGGENLLVLTDAIVKTSSDHKQNAAYPTTDSAHSET